MLRQSDLGSGSGPSNSKSTSSQPVPTQRGLNSTDQQPDQSGQPDDEVGAISLTHRESIWAFMDNREYSWLWWPGEWYPIETVPQQVLDDSTKTEEPLIGFWRGYDEGPFVPVSFWHNIMKYQGEKRLGLIETGLKLFMSRQHEGGKVDKFPEQVDKAEKYTGGELGIVQNRFGITIKECYVSRIMIQPSRQPSNRPSPKQYRCSMCAHTTTCLNELIRHNRNTHVKDQRRRQNARRREYFNRFSNDDLVLLYRNTKRGPSGRRLAALMADRHMAARAVAAAAATLEAPADAPPAPQAPNATTANDGERVVVDPFKRPLPVLPRLTSVIRQRRFRNLCRAAPMARPAAIANNTLSPAARNQLPKMKRCGVPLMQLTPTNLSEATMKLMEHRMVVMSILMDWQDDDDQQSVGASSLPGASRPSAQRNLG